MGGASASTMKYHYSRSFFTYSVVRRARRVHRGASRHSRVCKPAGVSRRPSARRSALKTVSGGEFDWGGTSVKR